MPDKKKLSPTPVIFSILIPIDEEKKGVGARCECDRWARPIEREEIRRGVAAGAPNSLPSYIDHLGFIRAYIGLELTWISYWKCRCDHFCALDPITVWGTLWGSPMEML
jgi:hypothetical protein